MHSLFILLFRSSYWKVLLRAATWREARLNLRRAHKDRRARKQLWAFVAVLSIPVICILYVAWLAGSGALLLVPFVLPIIWWRHRREKEESVPLHIVPVRTNVVKELTSEQKNQIRTHFSRLAFFYATMLARASSEIFLRKKVLPDGLEVTSRRTYIDLLQSRGLWDKIAASDRQALMIPDGQWGDELISQANEGMECMRLLRWILGIDPFLPTIGQQLRASYKLAHDFLEKSLDTVERDMVNITSIRVGRDAAQHYLIRCVAEAINQGCFEIEDDSTIGWAKELSSELAGKQHDDLVLEGKLVSESTTPDVLLALSLSRRRCDFLEEVMSIFESAEIPSALPALCVSLNRPS